MRIVFFLIRGLTDESEILKFLQHGTLVGLLPVPHPILIRKYQANAGTAMWFRTYMWGIIYLRYSFQSVRLLQSCLLGFIRNAELLPACFHRNVDPPIWYDTDIRLFEIQRI